MDEELKLEDEICDEGHNRNQFQETFKKLLIARDIKNELVIDNKMNESVYGISIKKLA